MEPEQRETDAPAFHSEEKSAGESKDFYVRIKPGISFLLAYSQQNLYNKKKRR